jgi:hypothetical protein
MPLYPQLLQSTAFFSFVNTPARLRQEAAAQWRAGRSLVRAAGEIAPKFIGNY